MERLLTKTRALALLVLVLALAALNRHDAILYAMAVTLATMAGLGHALPWLALRSASLRPARAWPQEVEATEGVPLELALRVQQQGWWPAWLVEVEAEWSWAGRSFMTRDTIAYLGPKASVPVLDRLRFACRGRYALVGLRLRSGFPLGLVEARREARVPPLSILVRPARAGVQLPAEWTVSEDSTGDHVLGHAGESLDLHMLRAYEPGDSVRRVDWRASARAGDLVVRQFQHPAAVVVKVVVQLPGREQVGRADAPEEHAVRAAAGLCAFLASQAVRTVLLLPERRPVDTEDTMAHALADALPGVAGWPAQVREAASSLLRGEQLVAVVAAGAPADALVEAGQKARACGGRLLVLVATWPAAGGERMRQASELRAQLHSAGVEAWLAWQ